VASAHVFARHGVLRRRLASQRDVQIVSEQSIELREVAIADLHDLHQAWTILCECTGKLFRSGPGSFSYSLPPAPKVSPNLCSVPDTKHTDSKPQETKKFEKELLTYVTKLQAQYEASAFRTEWEPFLNALGTPAVSSEVIEMPESKTTMKDK